jgi:hypothetical protein
MDRDKKLGYWKGKMCYINASIVLFLYLGTVVLH